MITFGLGVDNYEAPPQPLASRTFDVTITRPAVIGIIEQPLIDGIVTKNISGTTNFINADGSLLIKYD